MPTTKNEINRLEAVARFKDIDFDSHEELRGIVELASKICKTPVAQITLVDEDIQYIKVQVGYPIETIPRKISFCNHTIKDKKPLVINDMQKDVRFQDNPLVIKDPNVRFYAGSPLKTSDGNNVGALCVIDLETKELSDEQILMLDTLSKQVVNIIELYHQNEKLNETINAIKVKKKELRLSESKLRSFFESSSAIHIMLNSAKKIIAFNSLANQFCLAVFNREMKVGEDINDYVREAYKELFAESFEKAMAGERVSHDRFVKVGKNKTWINASYAPYFDDKKNIIGVAFTSVDITQRKQQEESLKRIAFIQSHEIRGPLSSILGLMNLIKSNDSLSSHESIKMLDKATTNLDNKIKEIVKATQLTETDKK